MISDDDSHPHPLPLTKVVNSTTSLDSEQTPGHHSGVAAGQQPEGKPDANSKPTVDNLGRVGHDKGRPTDQILELLKRLTTPGNRPGSLGRIDSYEVLGVVGQGAMGIVLRAYDESLQRIVAIKLMAPHLLTSTTAKDRFNREARSAAAVSHPNVVTIHAVSEVMGVPYLVMEFIEGQSLDQRIRVSRFDTGEVLRIANQMALGLSAAHRQGLIHRDIKPSNIMLEDSIERVRIADFGLARVVMDQSGLTSDGHIVGTPAYMSPEQVNGEHLDPRTDLFSVGCVMYSMLTGHSPFEARNGLAAWRAVISKDPEPLHQICGSAPSFLCDLIHRLLKKDPRERYQSADELATDLSRHLRGWNSVGDTPTVQLPSTHGNRHTVISIWATLAVAFAALAVVLGTLSQFSMPPFSASRSGASNTVSPLKPPPVQPPEILPADSPRRITVSRDGTVRFLTVADAIVAARPGSVIQILDAGPYSGALNFDDPERLRGVRIVGQETVIVNEGPTPIIRLAGVAEISIEGLVLNATVNQHGMEITGECPGLSVRNCTLQVIDSGKASIALVYLHHGAAGTAEKPIRLHNLELRFGGVGVVFSKPDSPLTTRHIRMTNCHFAGAKLLRGIPVVVFDGVRDVQVWGNLMENGGGVLSFLLNQMDSVQDFDFSWNTCRGFEAPFHLNESPQLSQRIRIRHNLLLDVAYCYASAQQIDHVAAWCEGNVWVHPVDDQQALIDRIAERRDQVTFKSSSAGNPEYLVPIDANINAGRSRWQAD